MKEVPVIGGKAQVSVISEDERRGVAEQLAKELGGEQPPHGPVIFEIPLEQPGGIDVLVVWNAWKNSSSTDRSNLILDAYSGSKTRIAQALGVTYQEAIEQQVLSYNVVPMNRPDEIRDEDLEAAMLAEGGFALDYGRIDLRFPTMSIAKQAHQRLSDVLPKGYWSITQTVGYVH